MTPDTPASEVARMMMDKKIHHVLVTDGNELLGIVSTLDFIERFVEAGLFEQ